MTMRSVGPWMPQNLGFFSGVGICFATYNNCETRNGEFESHFSWIRMYEVIQQVSESCSIERRSRRQQLVEDAALSRLVLKVNTELGGGFKDFLFSPLFGEDFQFD